MAGGRRKEVEIPSSSRISGLETSLYRVSAKKTLTISFKASPRAQASIRAVYELLERGDASGTEQRASFVKTWYSGRPVSVVMWYAQGVWPQIQF